MARYGTRAEAIAAWKVRKGIQPKHRHFGTVEHVRSGHGTETIRFTGCNHTVTREN